MLELFKKNDVLFVKALMQLRLPIKYQNKVFGKEEQTILLLPEEVNFILARNGNIRLWNGKKFIKLNLGEFYDKQTHRTIYLNNEDDTCCFPIEYDNSLFRAFETRKKIKRFSYNNFRLQDIKNIYSVFNYYRAKVFSIRFRDGSVEYFPHQIIDAIVSGEIVDSEDYTFDEADKLIVKYMNDQIDSILI